MVWLLSGLGNRGLRMVVSKSFLDPTRRVVESWMFAKRGIVRLAASGGRNVIVRQMRRGCDWLAVAWRLVVSASGLGNGCIVADG